MSLPESRLPLFEDLVHVVEALALGTATSVQVLDKLDLLQEQLSQMEEHFFSEVPYWLYLEGLGVLAEDVETGFALLHIQCNELRDSLMAKSGLTEFLTDIGVTQSRLLGNFQKLETWLSAEENYSDSPYINELIRVAYAVLEERLPLEALRSRLEGYSDVFRVSVSELSECPSSEVQEALELLESGLILVEEFLLEPVLDESLEEGLAALEEGGHLLSQAQGRMKDSEERERHRFCHRCSAENEATNKTCVLCGATLLVILQAVSSEFEVRVQESGITSVRPTYSIQVQSILSGVETAMTLGEAPPELERHMSTFNRGLHSLSLQLRRVTPVEETLAEVHQKLGTELVQCTARLAAVRSALAEGSSAGLQLARESFESSVLNLQALQEEHRNLIGN